jgi:hypothetical protein
MHKHLFTTLLLLCSIVNSQAQDLIVKKSGKTIEGKILKVTPTEVKYKRTDIPNSYLHIVFRTQIEYIQYENGTIDSLNQKDSTTNMAQAPVAPKMMVGDPYILGKADARQYYHRYTGAGTGTLIVSLISPLVGLLPATICSISDPDDTHLGYPTPEFMNNKDYAKGYMRQAKRIKSGKVWMNWAIAFGVNVLLVAMLSTSSK